MVKTPGDHNHFTIFNNAYGNNRYLTGVLKQIAIPGEMEKVEIVPNANDGL